MFVSVCTPFEGEASKIAEGRGARSEAIGVVVVRSVDRAADGGGVELEQVSKLGGARQDEVGGQQGGSDVVVGVERDVVDGGVLVAQCELGGEEGGVEQGEDGGLGEVMEEPRLGHGNGGHGQRFLWAAGFLGGS